MSVNACPHCGKSAISPLSKIFMAPARSTACRACGKPVSVATSGIVTSLPILIPLLMQPIYPLSNAAWWGLLALCAAVAVGLNWSFVHVVARTPNN